MLRLARPDLIRPRWLVAGVVAALGSLAVAAPASAATTPATPRVDLRVLVVTAGDAATKAIESAMDDDGVPYTEVDLRATGRPTLDAAYLEDAAAHHGRFQAVVLPNQAGSVSPVSLTAAELTALAGYEKTYGVRQVNGYDFPTTAMGATSAASGTLDGTTATVGHHCEQRTNRAIRNSSDPANYPARVNPGHRRLVAQCPSIAFIT